MKSRIRVSLHINIILQENKGRVPKVLDVELMGDSVNICMPGDDITLTGIIKVYQQFLRVSCNHSDSFLFGEEEGNNYFNTFHNFTRLPPRRIFFFLQGARSRGWRE